VNFTFYYSADNAYCQESNIAMQKRSDKSKECDYLSFGDAFPPTSFSFEAEGICMTFRSLGLYADDADFSNMYMACDKAAFGKFYKHDGYLFKESKLCVPNCSMRELLVREAHGGEFMGHFGIKKTLDI
jgi:hypothetical protein